MLADCKQECADKQPLETGGVFLGWRSPDGSAVVTIMVGPGPNAVHGRTAFEPDQVWQIEEIASHYAEARRRLEYLGDWHSHPGMLSGNPSRTDRRVLHRIMRTPSARCPLPLMAIFWGGDPDWSATLWEARIHRRALLRDRVELHEAKLHCF